MWHDLTHLGISVPDKMVRTIAVYLALVVLLRLIGKRDLGQFNTFDLVVMLLLSNVVQNAIIGPDNSLLGGLIGAASLLLLNWAFDRFGGRFPWLTTLISGKPTVLLRNGKWITKALREESLTIQDVRVAMRRQGTYDDAHLAQVTLETSGALSIEPDAATLPATKADLARLEARIEELLRTKQNPTA